jgi:hypothetical protein
MKGGSVETIVRKVCPGHFSLVFSKWNIDGMAGSENNVKDGKNKVFQSMEHGGKN